MNILDSLLSPFRKKATAVVSYMPADHHRFSDAVVNETSVLAQSAAWACANLLAGTVGSLPLVVYRTDAAGNRSVARDHPLYRLLHDSPNYDDTALDFWERGQLSLELTGNMFARKEMTGKRVTALLPFMNPTVTRTSSGSIRYRWSQDGRSYDEPQENVFHVRGFGGTPLGGLSTLSSCGRVFRLANTVNQAAQKQFDNGMRPSFAVVTDQVLNERRATIEEGLAAKHVGAMNAGRPLLLEAGLKPHNLSFSPEDAQMLESRSFSVEEICRIFGVPPIMIGHGEKTSSWGTGVQEVTLGFIKYTLRRRLKRIEMSAEKQLLTAEDRAQGVTIEFNLEGLLRGDSEGRAKFYETMVRSGLKTINECRALENDPPVEGGEVPRVLMQNVPLTEAGRIGPDGLPPPKE